jgi:ornithine cyclodeaminase/alanine dehydrogenase-like protein (mu-crystallin family)
MADCIAAVESAFAMQAQGDAISPGVLGSHVSGGGFHVKTAGLLGRRPYFAAKINANFPGNVASGLPTIRGILVLFDATDGAPLAVMDSAEITRLRTAAATAVAANHLARPAASTLTVCGCGVQGRAQGEALCAVRRIDRVYAFDHDVDRAERFAAEMSIALGVTVQTVAALRDGARQSDIVVTCTSSREPVLWRGDVAAGTFVAAVGADSEEKQEIDPELMAGANVVVDVLAQCASIGDLHHAIAAGSMTVEDVLGDLADVVSGRVARPRDSAITVFDSTGSALEDVAAASLVYERAIGRPHGSVEFDFAC